MSNKRRVRFDGAAPLPILLFLISVCASLMYTLCRSQFLPTALVMSALTAGIFLLFYKVRFRPAATGISVAVLTLGAWFAGSAANARPSADGSFMEFMFTASASFDLLYAGASILIFSLVVGFVGCYFSVISPRPCFLMLLMFIPFILSFRTARALPVYFTLIMAGCFIFACANLSVRDAGGAVFEDKSAKARRIGISCAAAVVITLIAAILPRANTDPVSDALDRIVPQDHGYFNTAGLSNFASQSSINEGNNTPRGTVLFTVDTKNPGYLKRWAFDEYTDDGWKPLDDVNTGYPGWEYNAQASDSASLLKKISESAEDLLSDNQELLDGMSFEGSYSAATGITIRDGSATYVVIHPSGIYRAVLPESCGRTYRTPRDDLFTENPMPVNCNYYLLHNVSRPNAEFLSRVDYYVYMALLDDAYACDIITSSERYAALNELYEANDYARTVGDVGITPEIQSLADEITDGLNSDYEKALALEKWFGEAGFVYDMEFVPEEKGAEYFLFKSRRGICSDYATALTLLARAAGLTARYCEGFYMSPETYDETTELYNITDAQAHAWPQIYIPGAGWLDFDATAYAIPADGADSGMHWLYAAAGAAVLCVLVLIFRKPLGWLCFCISYPLRGNASKIRGVYIRARRLAAKMCGQDENSLSTGEVSRILSGRLSMPSQAEQICSAADRLFYSQETPDSAGLLSALKALKKRRRRLK